MVFKISSSASARYAIAVKNTQQLQALLLRLAICGWFAPVLQQQIGRYLRQAQKMSLTSEVEDALNYWCAQ